MEVVADLSRAFDGRLISDAAEMAPFLTDWRGIWSGSAHAVVQPDTAEDVARIVTFCREHGISVVAQGGNTGLSGGAVPEAAGSSVLLSLARLNRVRDVDIVNDTMTVDAGCILANVQAAAEAAGRLFPLSLAAEGSCTIGGNLATNAGGTGVLRYGNARDLCLGLEVVTADGKIWNGLRGLRKDNTGYDLRNLFVGSEGTLGIITAAVLKLFPRPEAVATAFCAVPDPAAAVGFLQRSKEALGPALTAFELVPHTGIELVEAHMPMRSPLAGPSPWYVLIEATGPGATDVMTERMERLLADEFEAGRVTDAVAASSVSQARGLWALRENISEAQSAHGPTIKHDIALPISRLADFIASAQSAMQAYDGVQEIIFGHLGDGNLHYNISPSSPGADAARFMALQDPINRVIHDLVDSYQGSISAEHGLGVLRRDEMGRYKSEVELGMMRAVKAALDPFNIFNPGKLLPAAGDQK